MKSFESQAKTVEEAVAAGLTHLGVSISDVTMEILDEGSKGLFGLFGSKMAKVRLTVKEDMDDLMAELSGKEKKKPAPKAEAKAPVKREAPAAKRPIAVSEEPKEKRPVTPAKKAEEGTDCAKAQDFLTELTKLMGMEVEVHVSITDDGNVLANIEGDALGILIGRRGETLDALQYLTSLCVNKGKDGYTRVTLDTENYRAKREEALTRLANRMATRAVKTGRKVSLEPMNPYERRIIHSALQGNEQVDTHSEGEEPNRHLVITLKKQ
jgi:Predicted RNA-binding protein